MKNKTSYIVLLLSTFYLFTYGSCNKQPYKIDYSNIRGYVIGKEICHTDPTEDYWLIDFTYYANTPHIGDTLVLNGTTYTNVLKAKGLDSTLKQIGLRVSIDYKITSSTKIITTGCTIVNPVTYPLKEIFILNPGEIR
jgi:hypothetical protein